MAKQIFSEQSDEVSKKKLRIGINKIADAVGSTMGAAGKTVIISNHITAPPFVTKDGVTVASSIQLEDPIENMGAQMIRKASEKTAKDAGDGTTQTAVLAQAIISEGLKQISAGANPQDVKRGIELGVYQVIDSLKKMSVAVDDNEKIKNIATISANNDKFIGDLIAEAYSKISYDGLLLIEDSGTIDTYVDVVEGLEVDKGYISPHFANNKEKMQVNYDNPLFLITDYTIKTTKELAPIFAQIHERNLMQNGLIIFAQDFEGEAFSSMVINNVNGNVRCALIKAPAAYRKETLEDIATLTGATMISDESGIKMEGVLFKHLGSSKKVVVTQHKTTIINGGGKKEDVESLRDSLKAQLNDMSDNGLKEVWKKRIARVSGNIGIIKVGGATDIEVSEKRDRVDDACRASKSAIEEGVVVGGGVALLRCSNEIETSSFNIGDENIGIGIVKKICEAPLIKMLSNAGLDKSILAEVASKDGNYGFNVKTSEFEDLFKSGVIDPTKVIRCAIQNASSIACAVLTSDYFVVEMPKE